MAVITLTTDWHNDDYYISVMKGVLLKGNPAATVVDISHRIQRFSTGQAAFILKSSFNRFPAGTVHIIGVNCEANEKYPYVAVAYKDYFFISSDNGIFGMLFDEEPSDIVLLDEKVVTSFPEADVFAPAAAHLSQGKPIFELGKKTAHLKRSINLLPAFDQKTINGSVLYIDSYRNAITNISKELFESQRKERFFEILLQSNHNKITKLNSRYNETSPGEILALFNSLGLLEIAMYMGNVADVLNVDVNAAVRVKFMDKKEPDSPFLDNFKR